MGRPPADKVKALALQFAELPPHEQLRFKDALDIYEHMRGAPIVSRRGRPRGSKSKPKEEEARAEMAV